MIRDKDPILQALVASLFTWGVTALGAAVVFFLPPHSKKLLGAYFLCLLLCLYFASKIEESQESWHDGQYSCQFRTNIDSPKSNYLRRLVNAKTLRIKTAVVVYPIFG